MNKLFKFVVTASLLVLLISPARSNAQRPADSESDGDPYLREAYTKRPFPDARWEKATKGLGYTLKPGKPIPDQSQKGQNKQRKSSRGEWKPFTGLAEKIFIGLSVGMLLLAGIFIVLQLRKSYLNKRLPTFSMPPSSEEEAILSPQSLSDHILEAERKGDFGAAIRFLYLRVLQSLQHGAWIEWKREKTNRDYCAELKQTPFYGAFQFATRCFDRVRYGSYLPDEHQYRQEIAPLFDILLENIEKSKPGSFATGPNPPDYA